MPLPQTQTKVRKISDVILPSSIEYLINTISSLWMKSRISLVMTFLLSMCLQKQERISN